MRTTAAFTILTLVLVGTAAAGTRDLPGDVALEVSDAQLAQFNLGTSRLVAVQLTESIDAIARVMDVGPLAQLDSEIEGAAAAADASAREAQRLASLAADDQGASLQALEAARAQAAANGARLRLARQRVALEWGGGLARMRLSDRRQLVEQIAAGQAALLRVDPLQMPSIPVGTVHLQPPDGSPLAAENLGTAALAEPRMQTIGFFVTIHGDGAASLHAGQMLPATLETGAPIAGVMLPRSALVRVDGSAWAYLSCDGNRFVRREVRNARLRSDGWFVDSDFQPGDRIVDRGAGTLLAIETGVDANE